ncbi:MAG: ATP-dependent sacrificial sulfur transferase LarE [Promethearchaeota archaeon]
MRSSRQFFEPAATIQIVESSRAHDLERKLDALRRFFEGKKVVVAFSGGVDSGLLAYLAGKHAEEALLVTERSVLYPDEEVEAARGFAERHGIPHVVLDRDPLKDGEFVANPPERCYLCKKGLYRDISALARERGYEVVVDGTNHDDLGDHRPGFKAVVELGVAAPYVDLRVGKDEIRAMARTLGLSLAEKPSMACFSSRIPFRQTIDGEKLRRVRESERFLRRRFGLAQLRVRHHGDRLARVEVPADRIAELASPEARKEVVDALKSLGFAFVTLDLCGFVSGSMNATLDDGEEKN